MDLIDDYSRKATIERVIDGDTFVCMIDMGLRIYKRVTVRVFGLNCPEKTGLTKAQGLRSKDYTKGWFASNKEFMIRTVNKGKEDSFGRLIAEVASIDNNYSLSEGLLAFGLAVPYI
jgi:micrococcal nuclease